MRDALPHRRISRHHLLFHRPPPRRPGGSGTAPMRTSDLVLAVLGVVLLGGLALAAAYALAAGSVSP